MISLRDLHKSFGANRVLQGVTLDVARGESMVIIGGSGTGKSVLLKCILGLVTPERGTIEVDGRPADAGGRDGFLSRFGMLFQGGALFSSLTVAENVAVPLKEHYPSLPPDMVHDLAMLKIRMAGLGEDAGAKLPSQLSGGMRKRAALARALALDPALLFLDEPTAGLDPIGAAAFDALIRTLQKALGLTVFLITHDLDTLYTICDRVAVIGDRRVLINAPLAEVERFDHAWVQEYFHGPRGRAAQAARAKEA